MERRNEFDLNKSLKHWRNELRSQRSFTEENIEELQSHLMDQLDALKENGLSEEEAFLIACRRLGNAPELAGDFRKINMSMVWKERICLMVTGLAGYLFINSFLSIFSYWYYFFFSKLKLPQNQFAWGDLSVKIIGILLVSGFMYFIYKKYLREMLLEKIALVTVSSTVLIMAVQFGTVLYLFLGKRFRDGPEYYAQIATSGQISTYILITTLLLLGLIMAFKIKKEKQKQIA